MKKIFYIILILLVKSSFSQDQLFKKDNTKLEVKVLEINPTEIKYKLFNYQDGPLITILKSDVVLIIYKNGDHEVFNTAPVTPVYLGNTPTSTRLVRKSKVYKDSLFKELTSTKNIASFNVLEPWNGSFGISYMREFTGNLFNIYIPLSFGFTEPLFNQTGYSGIDSYTGSSVISDFRFTKKVIDIGLGIHFQTSGKRAVTHFIGPYFGIAQFNGTFNQNFYDYSSSYYPGVVTTIEHGFVMNRYSVMLDNGFLFRATKNFNILLIAGLGYRIDEFVANNPKTFYSSSYNRYYTSEIVPFNAFKLGLSFGYRF